MDLGIRVRYMVQNKFPFEDELRVFYSVILTKVDNKVYFAI